MTIRSPEAPASGLRLEAFPKRNGEGHQRVRDVAEDPLPRANPGAGTHRESSTPMPSRLPRSLAGLTVVVVDDDDASLEYFSTALGICGAVVVTALTAREALRLVEEQRPDVVLTDIAMIGEDGYWLVGEIRRLADQTTSLVPVVAATAYGREHSRDRALAAGFIEHLRKPIDPDLLCRTIASAAGR